MKIKVKRYKEIERIAIVEAVQRVLGEEVSAAQIVTAVAALKGTGLDPEVLAPIIETLQTAAIAADVAPKDIGLELTTK